MKYVRVDGADGRTNINVTSWSFTVDNHGNADLPYWIPVRFAVPRSVSFWRVRQVT